MKLKPQYDACIYVPNDFSIQITLGKPASKDLKADFENLDKSNEGIRVYQHMGLDHCPWCLQISRNWSVKVVVTALIAILLRHAHYNLEVKVDGIGRSDKYAMHVSAVDPLPQDLTTWLGVRHPDEQKISMTVNELQMLGASLDTELRKQRIDDEYAIVLLRWDEEKDIYRIQLVNERDEVEGWLLGFTVDDTLVIETNVCENGGNTGLTAGIIWGRVHADSFFDSITSEDVQSATWLELVLR